MNFLLENDEFIKGYDFPNNLTALNFHPIIYIYYNYYEKEESEFERLFSEINDSQLSFEIKITRD